MICLVMREGPFFWLHACTRFAFTTLGSLAPTVGLLQYREMQLWGKAQLLTMWTTQGSSWTLRSLGNLDIMDLLDLWISWRALGFLTSTTFWKFWHLGNLGSMDLLVIWISLRTLVSKQSFLDLPWENSWTYDILGFLTVFWHHFLLNRVSVTCHKFYLCTIRWWNQLVYTWVPL